MQFSALMADLYEPGGLRSRLSMAAHRFMRKPSLPHGEQAFKVAAIRRLASKLGRVHRF